MMRVSGHLILVQMESTAGVAGRIGDLLAKKTGSVTLGKMVGPQTAPCRPLDVNDQRSVDGTITVNSHLHSDFVNTWDHYKSGVVNGLGAGQRFESENLLGSIDWKPLKWTRSESMCSRGSGLSNSSSSKSMGVDSSEARAEAQMGNVTPVQSPSGDVVAFDTSAVAPSEETSAKKKPRLGWGEGLAKYEKKKVVGLDDIAANNEAGYCGRTEPLQIPRISRPILESFMRSRTMKLPPQIEGVIYLKIKKWLDPLVASFSCGAVGVISSLMILGANNNIEQQ
ncbi:hypothetical protein RHGRI_007745 [Rhododendron griersonianum]|uniref:Uncharacterized protein n=1 Tax=Rhododendron griersonianum TaxID=479676 RepID=A0AAV6KYU2_9ERIC|nr:hypothetical protein RHGRI_007745 [Rhododendron griersonianum]